MPLTIRYQFRQRFAFSAQKAFDWCTDFDPKDQALKGYNNSERQVSRITENTVILKDVSHLPGRTIEKQKLVQLYPEKLLWTSTHLTGPNKFSQFLYQIKQQGKDGSILNFNAIDIEYDEKLDSEALALRLCKEDSAAWKLLAKAMAEELGK